MSWRKTREVLLAAFIIALAAAAGANGQNTTTTWVVADINYLSLSPNAIGCLNFIGSKDINVTVSLMPFNSLDDDAAVSAIITKPNNSTQDVNFSSLGSGAYGYNYNFDSNGTYKIDFSANDFGSNAVGSASLFAYVGNFDLNISFLNNSSSYTAGATGTVRNYVTNIEGNAMTGLAGSSIIYYPNSSVFASASMTAGSTDGEYYYNFTAPSTNGNYTATSSFTCGTNTDSNSAGRFTVSGAGEGTTSTGEGGEGGG